MGRRGFIFRTLEDSQKSKPHSPAPAMKGAVTSRNPTSKVCQLCGVAGYTNLLVTCCRCRRASQHRYCMPEVQLQIPDSWLCEECLMSVPVGSKRKVHNLFDGHKSVTLYHPSVAGEKQVHRMQGSLCREVAASKNFNIPKDGRGMVKALPFDKPVMQSSLRCPSLKTIENAKVKFLPPEEVTLACSKACKGQRNLGESSHSNDHANVTSRVQRRLLGSRLTSPGSKVTTGLCRNAEVNASLMKINEPSIATNDKGMSIKRTKILGCPSSNCVGTNASNHINAPPLDTGVMSRKKGLGFTCSDAQSKGHSDKEMSFSKMFLMNIAERALSPALDVCWKGTFEVSGVYHQTNTGIQAHYPREMAAKAYEILKNVPVNLKLKIVPRLDVWPKQFQLDTPSFEDVGLYFKPNECERSKEKYACLLSWINTHDSAMQTSVGDTGLLIFSSAQLTRDCQCLAEDNRNYLWGVFKSTKNGKHQMHNLRKPSQVAAGRKDNNYPARFAGTLGVQDEVNMEIDMIGGTEVGRVDFPLPNRNGPPGFQRQIRRDASHACMSANRFPMKKL